MNRMHTSLWTNESKRLNIASDPCFYTYIPVARVSFVYFPPKRYTRPGNLISGIAGCIAETECKIVLFVYGHH